MTTTIRLAAVAMALALAGSANAFDTDGFRSGMSVADFKAVALQGGAYKLTPVPWDSSKDGGNYITDTGFVLSYCKDRLFAMNKKITGGVDGFASEVKDMISQYGPPQVSASSNYEKQGLFSDVDLSWSVDTGETKRISLKSYSGQMDVLVSYNAWPAICK
ncbi:hypothetical protein [Rhizobium sp. RAF56]|uniref:hypothetical protein n=1 Tax=Rhizobium sp. RAF56 TaxID=3233062 RepID=UPI003F94AF03